MRATVIAADNGVQLILEAVTFLLGGKLVAALDRVGAAFSILTKYIKAVFPQFSGYADIINLVVETVIDNKGNNAILQQLLNPVGEVIQVILPTGFL